VPLGAFVEPNVEQMDKSSRRARMDIFAAGITVNTALAAVAILLLSGMGGTITSDYEDDSAVYRVDADSPAYAAGIPVASIITAVNGVPVDSVHYDGQYSIGYDFDPTQRYDLTYQTEDGEFIAEDVQMGAYIRSVVSNGPAHVAGITYGQFLYSIDGVPITNTVSFMQEIRTTGVGEFLTIGVVDRDSTVVEYIDVTLGTSDNGQYGFLGVSVTTGGMTMVTPGHMMDVSMNPFYGATDLYSHFKGLIGYLSGPFNGMDPVSDEIKWWYDTPVGDIFWILLSLLYWVFWLNLLLGISNALPAYPFDGGHLFHGFISWLLEKIGYGDEEKRQNATDSIMNSVSTLVLFMFGLVVVAMLI
jgi:membrane-associated protease RseP (regulator of RpoE activity)